MKAIAHVLVTIGLLSAGFVTQAAEFTDQRVFTRAEQRQKLDRAREGMRVGTPDPSRERVVEVEEPPEVPEVRLQGFVLRSDGPPAVWANDGSTLGSDRISGGVRVYSGSIRGNTVLIRLPDGRHLRLKPGQRYDPQSGQVLDAMR